MSASGTARYVTNMGGAAVAAGRRLGYSPCVGHV